CRASAPPWSPTHPRHAFVTRLRGPPTSSLFPYTTLFRSLPGPSVGEADLAHLGIDALIRRAGHGQAEKRLELADRRARLRADHRSEEHTSELQSREKLVCRLLLGKKNKNADGTEVLTRAA